MAQSGQEILIRDRQNFLFIIANPLAIPQNRFDPIQAPGRNQFFSDCPGPNEPKPFQNPVNTRPLSGDLENFDGPFDPAPFSLNHFDSGGPQGFLFDRFIRQIGLQIGNFEGADRFDRQMPLKLVKWFNGQPVV